MPVSSLCLWFHKRIQGNLIGTPVQNIDNLYTLSRLIQIKNAADITALRQRNIILQGFFSVLLLCIPQVTQAIYYVKYVATHIDEDDTLECF